MKNAVILLSVFFVTFGTLALVDKFNLITKTGDFLPDHEFEVIGNEPDPKLVEVKPFKNILEKVEAGKNLLFISPPLAIVDNGVKKKELAVAILDTKTGEVFERRYWIEDGDLQKANQLRTSTCGKDDLYPHFTPSGKDSDYLIIVNWWNAHNSNLGIVKADCSDQDRYIVVANKVAIPNERLVYLKDRTGKKYSDIVYAPYSEQLHREEVVQEGLNYLNQKVSASFSELNTLKVESRAIPGKMITETMTMTFVKNLFINEQSDPSSMISSDDGGKRVAERVLIRLGLNKDSAFNYTYSSAGALGLGQIMPQTYQNIISNYPEVPLITDVGIGRADISNSIKASILVLDDHFASVTKTANKSNTGKKLLSQKSEAEIEDIRAAIYNGGPGKYQSLTGNISLAIPETVGYLIKLDYIRELHLFD